MITVFKVVVLVLALITAFFFGCVYGEDITIERHTWYMDLFEEDDDEMNIMETIGEPAVLEQLAEECAELAKAALKLARILREENPTPVTREEARAALYEEKGDVMVCLYVHGNVGVNYAKLQRWEDRILAGKA